MSFETLKDEVILDPIGRGYSGMSDQEVVDSLYTVDRPRNRTVMSGSKVLNAIVKAKYLALGDADKDRVWQLLHLGTLDPFGVEADLIVDIFGGGSSTVTALQSARVETISRLVELGLQVVRVGHVQLARAV